MKYCPRDSSPCQLNHKKLASNRSSHNKSLHTDEKFKNNHPNVDQKSSDIKVRKNNHNTDNKLPMTHHDTDIGVMQNHRLLNHRQPVLAGDPWYSWWSAAIGTTRAFQRVLAGDPWYSWWLAAIGTTRAFQQRVSQVGTQLHQVLLFGLADWNAGVIRVA